MADLVGLQFHFLCQFDGRGGDNIALICGCSGCGDHHSLSDIHLKGQQAVFLREKQHHLGHRMPWAGPVVLYRKCDLHFVDFNYD